MTVGRTAGRTNTPISVGQTGLHPYHQAAVRRAVDKLRATEPTSDTLPIKRFAYRLARVTPTAENLVRAEHHLRAICDVEVSRWAGNRIPLSRVTSAKRRGWEDGLSEPMAVPDARMSESSVTVEQLEGWYREQVEASNCPSCRKLLTGVVLHAISRPQGPSAYFTMSTRQLAEAAGVSRSTVARHEGHLLGQSYRRFVRTANDVLATGATAIALIGVPTEIGNVASSSDTTESVFSGERLSGVKSISGTYGDPTNDRFVGSPKRFDLWQVVRRMDLVSVSMVRAAMRHPPTSKTIRKALSQFEADGMLRRLAGSHTWQLNRTAENFSRHATDARVAMHKRERAVRLAAPTYRHQLRHEAEA